jgi:hypothetical protein
MSDYKFDKAYLLVKTNGSFDVFRRLYFECEKGNKFVFSQLFHPKTTCITHAAAISIIPAKVSFA